MSTSHKALIRQYFELRNARRWNDLLDFIDRNFAEDFVIEIETFVDRGFSVKKADDKVVVDLYPFGQHPVEGKLKNGDEIIFVQEGERRYETLPEILHGSWGGNPQESVHVQARRDGQIFEMEFTPVINKGGDWPYPLEQWHKDIEGAGEWGEQQSELLYIVEEGSRVACFVSHTGCHEKFQRTYAYTQAWIFEFRGGKIARFLEVHNTLAEYIALGYKLTPPDE
jgi:hypothetical protein